MPNILLSLIIGISYASLAVYFWRGQLQGRGDLLSRGAAGHLMIAPLLLHGYLLHQEIFTAGGFDLGVSTAISVIAWITLLVYWFARFFYPIGGLQAVVLPIATVAVFLAEALPVSHPVANTQFLAFKIHISVAMLAYALFTIAVLHAVLIAQVEKRLHSHKLPLILQKMPPLLTMESLLFRMIAAGFVLLTLTLGSGVVFSEEIFGQPWKMSHKVLFGLISWGVFAVLLFGHYVYGWRGRIAVRWTVSGFAFLLLAYLGSKFVLEMLLGR